MRRQTISYIKQFLFPFFILLGFAPDLSAQDCQCPDEFQFLIRYMEKNYAGYRDKAMGEKRFAYDSVTADMVTRAATVRKPAFCVALMKEWLVFFRDGHNYITPASANVDQPASASTPAADAGEVIRLAPQLLALLKTRRTGVEGIYHTSDSTYTIAIVQNKTGDRDYAGVIVSSKAPTWKKGQVKLELRRLDGRRFIACGYLRDHSVDPEILTFDGRIFGDGIWIRDGTSGAWIAGHQSPAAQLQWQAVQARRLSDKTYYIGIGSFDESNTWSVDSLFHVDSTILASVPNLILDLRGNGGGSDFVYSPLRAWLYSGPIINSGIDVLATADNARSWAALLDAKDIPDANKVTLRRIIEQMQGHNGQMVEIYHADTVALSGRRPFPQRIAVLINGECASSAEQFLMEAMQSRKVTLMGQPTAGILDYANVRDVALPCLPFVLHYATTRSQRVDAGKGIDNVGIRPQVMLGANQDWVEEARRYLEK
jgi:Peptidase family S41